MKINTKLRRKAVKRIMDKIYDRIVDIKAYRRYNAIEGDYERAKTAEKAIENLNKKYAYWHRRFERYKKK